VKPYIQNIQSKQSWKYDSNDRVPVWQVQILSSNPSVLKKEKKREKERVYKREGERNKGREGGKEEGRKERKSD
jgi:hypothetical protein